MSDYKVTDSELTGIANAIRTKGGTSSQLVFPDGFTSAIGAIPTGGGTIQQLSVNANGTYTPPSGVDGYAPVVVAVPGGGTKNILGGTVNPTSADGNNGDIYIKYTDYSQSSTGLPEGYQALSYLAVGADRSSWIDTGIPQNTISSFEFVFRYTDNSANYTNNGVFGAGGSFNENELQVYNGNINLYWGSSQLASIPFDTEWHTVSLINGVGTIDGSGSAAGSASNNGTVWLLSARYGGENKKGSYLAMQSCRITANNEDYVFIPAMNKQTRHLGMYDTEHDVFYENSGSVGFIPGEEVSGKPIDTAYLKVNGSWILLEDGDWDDVNKGA